MNEVLIDGIKYIPVTEVTQIQLGKIRDVLESQGYLSESAINDILKGFKSESKIKKPRKTRGKYSSARGNKFKYNSTHKRLFNIGRVLENGGIIYKTRNNPANWNIQQAMVIRDSMDNDSTKNMSYRDVIAIEKRVKLSKDTIRKIMYNIEYGDLSEHIDKWRLKNLQEPVKVAKPLQNNPQKRKDEGYGWVV